MATDISTGDAAMSSVKDTETVTSTASREALELLSCFYNGIDDVVYQIAEDVARQREGTSRDAARPVQIEADDVKKAAEQVMSALREMAKRGSLPSTAGPALDAMQACFENHTR